DGKPAEALVTFTVNGSVVKLGGVPADPQAAVVDADDAVYVIRQGRQTLVRLRDADAVAASDAEEGGLVRAPMHGKVLALLVKSGAKVSRGQPVAIIEAMKMEHTLTAPAAGTIVDIRVVAGGQVADGAIVAVIETGDA